VAVVKSIPRYGINCILPFKNLFRRERFSGTEKKDKSYSTTGHGQALGVPGD
jgi:hypothetical protein